jgi:hypothetical protein
METPRTYPNGLGGRKVNDNPQPDTWRKVVVYGDVDINADMPREYRDMIEDCLGLWAGKLTRNMLKYRYYNGKNVLKDFGISIPPSLLSVETVVGWPQKAVDALAVRSRLNAFTGDATVTDELDGIARANDLYNTYRMAVVSELTHSCAAMTVTRGADGMPIIRAHSATTCAMLWDFDRHRIRCGVTVADVDEWGQPVAYNLYEDDCVVAFRRLAPGRWAWQAMPQPPSRPLMEPLIFRASLDRPFGMPRISRAVMSITDSAVRTALRSEISAEFFSIPQKYILGTDPNAEPINKWTAAMSAMLEITKDENGEKPTIGQFQQQSMTPHIEQLKMFAAMFAGETGLT